MTILETKSLPQNSKKIEVKKAKISNTEFKALQNDLSGLATVEEKAENGEEEQIQGVTATGKTDKIYRTLVFTMEEQLQVIV